MHHGLAICADLQIGLHSVAAGDGRRECRCGVLDHSGGGVVQTTMRERSRGEPIETGHEGLFRFVHDLVRKPVPTFRDHALVTSNRPSTSKAASAGNAATPTVERAWRPLSPNTSTIRSEAPFITFGPSAKPGAELMKSPSRTTRLTLSRSPSAPLICARRLTAQARAACCPSSIDTPPPSWPLATSLPSAPKQSWPETTSRLPLRTNGT